MAAGRHRRHGLAFASAGAAVAPALLAGLALVPVGLGLSALRLRTAGRRLPPAPPLNLVAHAVVDAYRELGELRPTAADSLAVQPRASGYLRCVLTEASAHESRRFAAALEEALGVVGGSRYLVTRLIADPGRSPAGLLARSLTGRGPFEVRHHSVPHDLGRNRERAHAFWRAWSHWLGPSRLVFTQRSHEGRRAAAAAAAQAPHWEALQREVWT